MGSDRAQFQEATPAASLPAPSPSVTELQEALANGETTVRELVEAAMARIDALDQQGATVNAVIEINPDALTIADELDAELASGTMRSPMHGIPVLIKDNIGTGDQMETTAGSLALVGLKAHTDSAVARQLREAGMVILGKTNLSEWANIRSFYASSGWSGRGGQTVNPYLLDRNASGSSSGSGAAAAAGYVAVTVGTETNGSIVSPAGNCGVVGIKPTVGLVSRVGVIPISHSQDTIGPMATSVASAAALLNVLAAPDPADAASNGEWPVFGSGEATPVASLAATPEVTIQPIPSYPQHPSGGIPEVDYTAALDPTGLQGARIGVLRGSTGFSPDADAVFEEAIAAMREAGAEIVDPVEIPSEADPAWGNDTLPVLEWELKAGLADYFAGFLPEGAPIASLADVIAFNDEHADEELQYFDQGIFVSAESRTGLDDPEYQATVLRLQYAGRDNGLDAALESNALDALIAPTNAPATKIDLVNGDFFIGGTSTLAAIAGYPLVTVPAGYRHGLPIGVTFMGGAFSEETLIRLAYAFEQQVQVWTAPSFVPGSVIPPEE
ncbi:MAG: amidase [Chloroflexia bacterium]|nr:amidase [Chloroflexia bacterium]